MHRRTINSILVIAGKERATESGCNDYISKPIDRNSLTGLILKYTSKKKEDD
jgi:CheY-like chemotaxis protein